ncbi:MAG: peroxide stress protein YaaA [Gammaproteobacteria bacterium]|nr:peroxide stress protein YaaA [Gammaproteobacteria bacterium]
MLAVISPAKSLDFETRPTTRKSSTPAFVDDAAMLIEDLVKLAPGDVSDLMGISQKLGELNCDRYNEWRRDTNGGKQAALAFTGDVYMGLGAWDFTERELTSLQRRVRILSGLYGLLKPLDKIHPYRLEMGTSFANKRGPDLYSFWGESITDALNAEMAGHRNRTLVNLASNEYWRAVDPDRLDARILDTRFLDTKNGNVKFISFFAKKARGLMAAYIAKNRVETVKALKAFDYEGYRYSEERSSTHELVYVRPERH